ncbi:hypothetical protein RND81_11G047000 [Saponaria officinalis]|uniref:Uncharacterized protein n=1 Tax=Saponaria officinalis TaxID=3572 RepID=A0AAW1HIR5_SAPOF
MAASSSSPPSGNEMKYHPYQVYPTRGPNGSYEARQVKNSGLYVRVDMPGVPPDGVKLVKYGETRTVTFSGKAPKYWSSDSSGRVYGGYVVLDRDPTEIKVDMEVKNGCMRLVFEGAEGTLHYLGGLKRAPNVEDRGEDDSVVYNDSHASSSLESSVSPTIAFSHINPYLIQGVEGVHENRLLKGSTDEIMYVRTDMPGLADNLFSVGLHTVNNKDDTVCYGGEGINEHPFDEDGRAYYTSITLYCGCCQIVGVHREIKHGVARVLIKSRKIKDLQQQQLQNRRCRGSNSSRRGN